MEKEEPHVERRYRGVMEPAGLTCYSVVIGESDLYICTRGDLSRRARESLAAQRADLESYLEKHLPFGTSFRPIPVDSEAPEIAADMARAAGEFDVGPMASVAGAIAQHVGTDLLEHSDSVIVENGGDIFVAGGGARKIRLFAGGDSPAIDIIVTDTPRGIGVCTSSATVGPSVSLGQADAVTVLGPTATDADAAATAIGNIVLSAEDIQGALEWASGFEDVHGVVIVADGAVGAWGDVELA